MRLMNPVLTACPIIPDELKGKFEVAANYALSDREANLFYLVLLGIVKELKKDKVDFETLYRVSAIITKDGSFSLDLGEDLGEDDTIIGARVCLAIYAVERWRKRSYADQQIMIIFAEELCHHYWNIEDEVAVKYKVYNIVKEFFPGSTFEQFFTI